MAKKTSKKYVLIDGSALDLGKLDARQRAFLADLEKMKKQAVSYFEIYRAALGPGSPSLAGHSRVDRKIVASDLYLVARDIATRAGVEQGLVLAPQHEAQRPKAPTDASMISVTQAAELIGITRAAVYKAIEKDSLSALHIGNVTVVNRESALAYRSSRNKAVAATPPRDSRARPTRSTEARRRSHSAHA